MDDFKKLLYGVLIGFALLIVGFVSFTFIWSCGLDFSCKQATPPPAGTPVPTLIPATLPAPITDGEPNAFGKCEVRALDLLAAWVDAGYPETNVFSFADVNGNPCEGTFATDVALLLGENNVWFPASLSCTSCHNSALTERSAGLDLTSYAGILAGSRRASADTKGTDILGGGVWENSLLFRTLTQTDSVIDGHPPLTYPAAGLVIYAGAHTVPPTPTDAPVPTEASSATATP